MEAKFFSEIEKKMDVKTLKDFEKDVRTQINNEFESLRKKNDDLSRVLMAGECEMWEKIRNEEYSWLQIKSDKKKKLYRLIDIYSKFDDIVDSVKDLNTKVDRVKQLKDTPVDSSAFFVYIFLSRAMLAFSGVARFAPSLLASSIGLIGPSSPIAVVRKQSRPQGFSLFPFLREKPWGRGWSEKRVM